MDLAWLDDILVLLEERNMTRAAERRNITQPAFSRRIRSFEDWLGAPIIDRQANRIELSDALASRENEIRALVDRLRGLRTNIANYDARQQRLTIAAQHAQVCSSFPDMALRARTAFPGLHIRLRAANVDDCISALLRGDADMFLCYEAEHARSLDFGEGILRGNWGSDFLVPVVGGSLRYSVRASGHIDEASPAIVYPEDSYFGRILARGQREFGTAQYAANPVCVTAFSSGVVELVLSGLGVGWLPYSMVHRHVASGTMISLANTLGQEPLRVAMFANCDVPIARDLMAFWQNT
ncbi:LysR substrate-binding domain-containing protein [Tateyamaria sp. ANG-S1]|uniref:LysR family transcriptional regulator n=1 Tax=Tateyamaria sp. ANG-S1 TaxID=1577905 RepID=UPI00057EC310|nr:LysR substrate-binding domain-containing protein [Tateyamaria sp. ANG-S1]KIC51372.1 LysR family transcriptional regulator [Tateyamaria sp. ANG-S1]